MDDHIFTHCRVVIPKRITHSQNIFVSFCFSKEKSFVYFYYFTISNDTKAHLSFDTIAPYFFSSSKIRKYFCRCSHKTETELFSRAAATASTIMIMMVTSTTMKDEREEKRCFAVWIVLIHTSDTNDMNAGKMGWSQKQANNKIK